MVIKQERNTRKLLERARCRGQLVDLSDEARQAGLLCRCEVDVDLYRSLFWKYPSAGVQDTIAVGDLLHVLQSRLQCSRRPGKSLYAIRPPQPTWWMQSRYYLKLLVLYRGHRVESVVILSQSATLETLSSNSPPSVSLTSMFGEL